MPIDPQQPSQLDYQSHGSRPAMVRSRIVMLAGAVIALIGIIIFYFAHAIHNLTASPSYNPDGMVMHEFLWGALGIALLLVGGLLGAVGLMSWCRAAGYPAAGADRPGGYTEFREPVVGRPLNGITLCATGGSSSSS